MTESLSRREALKRLGVIGAGAALAPAHLIGGGSEIVIAGQPVEIAVASVSSATVRITVQPIVTGRAAPLVATGELAAEDLGRTLSRTRDAASLSHLRAGNLDVTFTDSPPTLSIETSDGTPVQRLELDAARPGMSFLLGDGPLLGLGEGGPQFDRKGSADRMRSGQGGYMLRTHGGRVPI
ncbi:MAG: twin-arginine translocation signal domain-containing protein, partial [Gemmatimonadaceae bacterium]